jgi:hypothetical protein
LIRRGSSIAYRAISHTNEFHDPSGQRRRHHGIGQGRTHLIRCQAFPKAACAAIIVVDGISYSPSEFDQLLLFDRPHASQLTSGNDVLDVVSDILKKCIE